MTGEKKNQAYRRKSLHSVTLYLDHRGVVAVSDIVMIVKLKSIENYCIRCLNFTDQT